MSNNHLNQANHQLKQLQSFSLWSLISLLTKNAKRLFSSPTPFGCTIVMLSSLHLIACQSLPSSPHTQKTNELTNEVSKIYAIPSKSPSFNALAEAGDELDYAVTKSTEQHDGLSGYHLIITGTDAFAARSVLTDMSTKTIDVQYYIWHNDEAGQLLLKELWLAAQRGVIVRLLLDDFNNDAALDAHLLRFSSHPNTSVRLVNPFVYRNYQPINYLTDMRRINHRMHNKSMTFDRKLAIIGGRNVGDEYFSNGKVSQFADLDVLLIGDVVTDINASFEEYWRSDFAYDIETLVNDPQPEPTVLSDASFLTSLDKINDKDKYSLSNQLLSHKDTFRGSSTISELLNENLTFTWVDIDFFSDKVNKIDNTAPRNSYLLYKLRTALGTPQENLTIISSYFVPTAEGVKTLVEMAEQGVAIKILTNSFKATDVTAVHSGYGKWRTTLLSAGIELYELKPTASVEDRENKLWRARSQSSTSLHAKTFAVDSSQVFLGSYNVDPRSANINTEMGVIITDATLATKLQNAVSDEALLGQAYKVLLNSNGNLQWQTIEDGKLVTYDSEPDVGFTDHIWIWLMSILPIDWLL